MKLLFVAGSFDDNGGRPSGYVRKLVPLLLDLLNPEEYVVHNGGTVAQLQALLDFKGRADLWIPRYDVIFWWADIDNAVPKFVKRIKELHPKCLLVTSKQNFDEKYDYLHLFARALSVKANLLVEFTGARDQVQATVMDPLGNAFAMKESLLLVVATALAKRVRELLSFHRVGSRAVEPLPRPPVSDEEGFFSLARQYAEVFHRLIHAQSSERFLGNLSFRCENGFPSMRTDGYTIWVSRRNIDKRQIGAAGFVPVLQGSRDEVLYEGGEKPSVDTPVQVALYRFFPRIRYMLHSHAYLQGAPFTKRVIPCGALEEVDDVMEVLPDGMEVDTFRVNLRGHGSIAAGSRLTDFVDLPYIARPMPERQF